MKIIYYTLIKKLDEQILETEIGKDGRLSQLYKKRDLLQRAFGAVS